MKKKHNIFSDIFILLSSWTRTVFFNRIAIGDIFGVFTILKLWLIDKRKVYIPNVVIRYFIFIILISFGMIVTKNQTETIVEIAVQIFLFLMLIVLINNYKSNNGVLHLIVLLGTASLISFFIGLFDINSYILNLNRVIDSDGPNVAIATFRNSGQAGSYAMIVMAILLPFRFSYLFKDISVNQKRIINLSLVFTFLGLIFTVKIAAYIGFLLGLFLWLFKKAFFDKEKKMFKILLVIIVLSSLTFLLISINPDWLDWFIWKIGGRGEGSLFSSSFIYNNWSDAIKAFKENLLLGTGLGGFHNGVYSDYEIHSTYLKIIGETGLIGMIAYTLLMIPIIKLFFIKKNQVVNTSYSKFIKDIFPFFIGCMVSWAYTFHLRKREFIIMLAILIILNYLAKNNEKSVNLKK